MDSTLGSNSFVYHRETRIIHSISRKAEAHEKIHAKREGAQAGGDSGGYLHDLGRDLISGIHRYSQERGNWELFIEPRGLEQRRWLPPGWKGEGVIARVGFVDLAKRSGFNSPEYMATVFRVQLGKAPLHFRKQD
jgi:AraC-like DNA-binding protein